MSSAQTKHASLIELRQHLKQRFPAAQQTQHTPAALTTTFSKRISIAPCGITEVVCQAPHSAPSLIIAELMSEKQHPCSENTQQTLPFALVDGRDNFDPASYTQLQLQRILWVRCQNLEPALQCADLLIRNGNLPLVLLDLCLIAPTALNRTLSTTWHRLRQLSERSHTALLVLSPHATVARPSLRFHLETDFQIEALDHHQKDLFIHLTPNADMQRQYTHSY